jgi:hypothetical protein
LYDTVCLHYATLLAKNCFISGGAALFVVGNGSFGDWERSGALNWEDSGWLWEWYRFREVVKEGKKKLDQHNNCEP